MAPVPLDGPRWETGGIVEIEAGFALHGPDGTVRTASSPNLGAQSGCLVELLEQCVVAIRWLERNALGIGFDGGAELRLLTDLGGHESFHIHIDGQSLDVTAP